MSAPSPVVRAVVYERDEHRCVSCGTSRGLQFQHRRATGMGGKAEAPKVEDGVTSCAVCNPAYESSRQREALRYGWKLRRWILRPELVPVFYWRERTWYQLTAHGKRVRISTAEALRMMRVVYGDEYKEFEA